MSTASTGSTGPTGSSRSTGPSGSGGSAAPAARGAGLAAPGILLGVGLGGFVDGILLHQVLQWHHMLSSTDTDNIGVRYYPPTTIPGLEMNTVWDGLFHVFTWTAVLLGLSLLSARAGAARGRLWSSRVLWGWVLVGAGLFNLVEGVVDHHILGIHHVRTGPGQTWWDLGFLALGAALVALGWALQRGGDREAPDRDRPGPPLAPPTP